MKSRTCIVLHTLSVTSEHSCSRTSLHCLCPIVLHSCSSTTSHSSSSLVLHSIASTMLHSGTNTSLHCSSFATIHFCLYDRLHSCRGLQTFVLTHQSPVRRQFHTFAVVLGYTLSPPWQCSLDPGKNSFLVESLFLTLTNPHFSMHSSSDQHDSDSFRSILTWRISGEKSEGRGSNNLPARTSYCCPKHDGGKGSTAGWTGTKSVQTIISVAAGRRHFWHVLSIAPHRSRGTYVKWLQEHIWWYLWSVNNWLLKKVFTLRHQVLYMVSMNGWIFWHLHILQNLHI